MQDFIASIISGVGSVVCHAGRAIKRSHQALSFGYSLKDIAPLDNQGMIVPATTSATGV
jgi:hypothetical protein